jgi:carbon storage regulator CsrA
MLVLTRKYQEKIRIGDSITITVLRTKGKAVRLGIEAPDNVPVIRGELSFESNAGSEETLPAATTREANGAVTVSAKRAARRNGNTSTWTAESPVSQSASQIGLQRVPRDKVAGVLPQLVAGNGPLRTMMDRR